MSYIITYADRAYRTNGRVAEPRSLAWSDRRQDIIPRNDPDVTRFEDLRIAEEIRRIIQAKYPAIAQYYEIEEAPSR